MREYRPLPPREFVTLTRCVGSDISRRRARNLAWYDPDELAPSRNPFKRFRLKPHRSHSIQLESRLAPVPTAKEMRLSVEGIAGPAHAQSFPSDMSSTNPVTRIESLEKAGPEPPRRSSKPIDGEVQFRGEETTRKPRRRWGTLGKSGRLAEDDSVDSVTRPDESWGGPNFTAVGQIKATILNSWLNVLFFVCPVGVALNYAKVSPVAIFVVNFIAIIPSSAMLGYAMDELSFRLDKKAFLLGLVNSTFGNAVQLIQSILLLRNQQLSVLRVSLLGTILSNLLFLTGLSFLIGGLRHLGDEQHFNRDVTQTITMLLFLAVLSLVIPTAAHYLTNTDTAGILSQSRGTAVIIIISYILWLIFELGTNRDIFDAPTPQPAKRWKPKIQERDASEGFANIGQMSTTIQLDPEPQLSLHVTIITIVLTTALIALNTQFATDSIQGLIEQSISPNFIGLVILPIISLDMGAIKSAVNDNMDLSISLTLGKCMQVALLVVPLTILLAWWMRIENMSLQFDAFSIVSLFIAIIIVGYVVQEGKSNWLTGALLMKIYIIIGLAAWWIP